MAQFLSALPHGNSTENSLNKPLADPGDHPAHPLSSGGSRILRRGGMDLVGGVDSRGSYVSQILYVKVKESGPSQILLKFCISENTPSSIQS